jgi:hypothetical protein
MNNTEDFFEVSIEKVLKSIKSCKNLNHVVSCEKFLELFKIRFENNSDITDFDETYGFLKSQLILKKDNLFVD